MKSFTLIAVALWASQAAAFHADIFLVQQAGMLVTGRGAADPGSGGIPRPGVRFHVNDIAGFVPFVDSNPGFSATAANNSFFLDSTYQPLPASRTLGFNLRAFRIQHGPAANLFYWNGEGSVSFQPVTNTNDRLQVRTVAGSAILSGSAVDVPGFDFTATDPQGAIHSHLTFDFDVDNSSLTPASTGVFLSAFEFRMNLTGDPVRETSRPHYVAWFNGPPGAIKSNAMAASEVFLASHFADLRLYGDVSPWGDDGLPDDLVDANDIDALLEAIHLGTGGPLFDLNSDATVDARDVGVVFDLLDTRYGDANLDGRADATDLDIWQENYGLTGGWAGGNFNGDTTIDGRDFLIWQRNLHLRDSLAATVRVVPEPQSLGLIACFLVIASNFLSLVR